MKGTKRGKVRDNISRPPAPFPVRTGRVIESFQGRLRKRHVDDQLHKLKVTSSPPNFLPLITAYSLQIQTSRLIPRPPLTSADLKPKSWAHQSRTGTSKEHAHLTSTRPIRASLRLGYQPIGNYYCLLPPPLPPRVQSFLALLNCNLHTSNICASAFHN